MFFEFWINLLGQILKVFVIYLYFSFFEGIRINQSFVNLNVFWGCQGNEYSWLDVRRNFKKICECEFIEGGRCFRVLVGGCYVGQGLGCCWIVQFVKEVGNLEFLLMCKYW